MCLRELFDNANEKYVWLVGFTIVATPERGGAAQPLPLGGSRGGALTTVVLD